MNKGNHKYCFHIFNPSQSINTNPGIDTKKATNKIILKYFIPLVYFNCRNEGCETLYTTQKRMTATKYFILVKLNFILPNTSSKQIQYTNIKYKAFITLVPSIFERI